MTDVDVLVVGAGPSGLTVAAEAARSGASVLVVEKRSEASVPRAGTLLPRPLELLDARGLADRFIRRTCEFNPHPFQTWHIWGGMAPVEWSARDSRFAFTLYLAQHETEAMLKAWAEELGVEVLFEHELVDLEDQDQHVEAVVRGPANDERRITAAFVVGADGGRSRTRQQAGMEFIGRDTSFTGIIATVPMDFPWSVSTRVTHNERGWLSAFPFGPGATRFVLVHAEGRYRGVDEPVTVEELTKYVSDILGEQVDMPGLVAAGRYGDAMRLASSLRKGRIFLVGESARVHYPASGVGMNFCIQDAFNLGWKLAAVLRGDAEDALLDTYETERTPIIRDLFESVDSQVAVQFDFSARGLEFADHFSKKFITLPAMASKLVDELNGLETPYPRIEGDHPSVGLPAPDFEMIRRDGSTVRLYELLRDHPFVVVDLTGRVHVDATEVEGLPAAVVTAHPIRLPEALHGVVAMLVRPDTYLAWATSEVPEPGAARTAVLGALHR